MSLISCNAFKFVSEELRRVGVESSVLCEMLADRLLLAAKIHVQVTYNCKVASRGMEGAHIFILDENIVRLKGCQSIIKESIYLCTRLQLIAKKIRRSMDEIDFRLLSLSLHRINDRLDECKRAIGECITVQENGRPISGVAVVERLYFSRILPTLRYSRRVLDLAIESRNEILDKSLI